MDQTIAVLLPWLNVLAGGGGGVLASWIFDQVRLAYPKDGQRTPPWLNHVLYAPRYARLSVLALSALISVGASVAVALLTTGDWPGALDAAFASALSGVTSQIWHGRKLETEPPPPPAPPYTGEVTIAGPSMVLPTLVPKDERPDEYEMPAIRRPRPYVYRPSEEGYSGPDRRTPKPPGTIFIGPERRRRRKEDQQ